MSLSTTNPAASRTWLAISLLTMVLVAVLERIVPVGILLVEFLALGPVLASLRLSPLVTGLLVILAEVIGVILGLVKGQWGTPDHWIAQIGILLFGSGAVFAAHLRHTVAREWQYTFDAVDSAVMILDLDGEVLRLNRTAADLQKTASAMSTVRVDDSWFEEPWSTAAQLIQEIRSTGAAASLSLEDSRLRRSWAIEVRTVPSAFPLPERILLLINDITRIVDLQQTLMRSESISAMGSLVAGVAHEVRNPLFTISASIDAFEARFGNSSEESRYLSVLRAGVSRLSSLMEQLLDYGKPTPYFPTQAQIPTLIGEALETLASDSRERQVRIDVKTEGALPPLLVDRGRLVQVFRNLILNALQHSSPGDAVTVTSSSFHENGRRWIRCVVEDEGPGIPPEFLSRVFEPFFTQRQDGTGLGLSIVRRIVDQLGGVVSASNRPEGGAVITVRLPLMGGGVTGNDGT